MHITIRKSSDHNERRTIWLPMEEEELGEVCEGLGIEMTTEPNCYIENSRDWSPFYIYKFREFGRIF